MATQEKEKKKKPAFTIEGNATGVADAADIDLSEDADILNEAAKWVVEYTGDNHTDPFDGGVFGHEGDGPGALIKHLKTSHATRVVAWYLNPELGADALSLKTKERNGEIADNHTAPIDLPILALEDNMNPRYTRVPDSVARARDAAGQYGRWVNQSDLRHYLNMGFRVAQRPKDEELQHQHDSTDSALRSREMVYMLQPGKMRKQTEEMRIKMRAEQNVTLPARQENAQRVMTDVGKETYDYHVRNGMPSQNALVLARRAEREGQKIK